MKEYPSRLAIRSAQRNWFLDTEFSDNGSTVDLISLALVCDSVEYYAVATDGWSPRSCTKWVQEHVLPRLPDSQSREWKPRKKIASEIRDLLLDNNVYSPRLWGYYSAYDWVVFCQLFGSMVDLPKGFPYSCFDLKQEMDRLLIKKEDLPLHLLQQDYEHHALMDARWNRQLYEFLKKVSL